MTEEMTLLGVVLFAYLVFLWMRDRKIWLAFLCGGCIGATSLLRLNPLFLFPAVACLITPEFWRVGKKILLRHLSAYTLAFLILLIPGIISSVSPDGTPYLLQKLQGVIHERYGSIAPSSQRQMGFSPSGMEMAAVPLDGQAVPILLRSSLQGGGPKDYAQATPSQSIPSTLLSSYNPPGGIVPRFLYHLLHNFSTSFMSLPDSLIYDDLNHLTQPIYWADAGGWQGNLPLTQTMLVFLNLFLVSIGLGYSWIHHSWAGMIPMTIFIAYSVSLGAAMNSGGRYINPMDWIIYFYYGLAIVAIVQFVYKVLAGKDKSQPVRLDSGTVRGISDRRKLGFSLAGIIFLASLIPIANFVMPVMTASTRNLADVEAVRKSISAHENPGVNIVYGKILYPYYEDGRLAFDFITPSGDVSYVIDGTHGGTPELRIGENAFIGLQSDAQGKTQVESIYLWQDAHQVLIWRLQP